MRRAHARAQLTYEPATLGRWSIRSDRDWPLTAPLGPVETEDLRWYLEKYAVWPSDLYQDRVDRIEQALVTWGRALYQAALPAEHAANVLHAWARIDARAERRFSVLIDPTPLAGSSEKAAQTTREAATALLGLPWELLHDGQGFLCQGARPTRVRRRLPNTGVFNAPPVATPIRILLITARPEDNACAYLDHRASALPLVEATERLGGQVALDRLEPPTLPALRRALEDANEAETPYHVVHFDGHGVYDRRVGLGGLCFEDPQDSHRLERRRHQTIYTNELGPLLRDHRIPLVFLEVCQGAQADRASESVASELLKVGVASVVAMSHSVLLETARRFVAAFYAALAQGARVGAAMLAGQRALAADDRRGRRIGGELRLRDWFVPVLFQEQDDPQLFTKTPGDQTRSDIDRLRTARLGELPAEPATGFIGRSRELLALERLLRREPYALIRGQGGEGKTALAVELARWLVRSHQLRRAAFVSVETHTHPDAVLDALGHQLIGQDYSVAKYPDRDRAILPLERALAEQPTLLILDNLESLLPPPYIRETRPQALDEEADRALADILALGQRLNNQGRTRLVLTSREALPAPFDAEANRRELHQLAPEDAIRLVERALDQAATAVEAEREAIEELVDTVQGHARTLALLAPSLRAQGVEATRQSLAGLMAEMERRHPGDREHSLFAGIALSLDRLSPENRERARVLALFHGGVDLNVLCAMMEWEAEDVIALAQELIETGLATPHDYAHIALHPALGPSLRRQLDPAEQAELTGRWRQAMQAYVAFLDRQQHEQAELAATLTRLELPNLLVLLEQTQNAEDPAATIDLVTALYSLLQNVGKPRLLARVGEIRDAAAKSLGADWGPAAFEAHRTRIEQELAEGRPQEALAGAQELLQRARSAGKAAYAEADYDLAMACWLLARILKATGNPESALPLLDEAQADFETIVRDRDNKQAERMASVCFIERGGCLLDLGRLEAAADAYEQAIERDEKRGAERSVAVNKGQLGTVRLQQRRYPEALAAYAEARERFTRLGEPGTVAGVWHQTGMACQEAGQPEAAEAAYQESLAIWVQLDNPADQASTLLQLGNLYADSPDRLEEAVIHYQQATDLFAEAGDAAKEGVARNNLGEILRRLGRFDDARREAQRAIECNAQFGQAAEPWTAWAILAEIEKDAGNHQTAAKARDKAIAAWLAHRRAGGENHNTSGRLALAVTQALQADNPAAAKSLLEQVAAHPELPDQAHPFISALQAIVAGNRDPALAADPNLHYTAAAELHLLLETPPPNPNTRKSGLSRLLFWKKPA